MSTTLSCPGCGASIPPGEVRRDAEAFCETCDYPLFWAPVALQVAGEGAGSGIGLRRLPGAGGHAAEASVPCPTCRELNALTAVVCARCRAEMHPTPIVVVEAP